MPLTRCFLLTLAAWSAAAGAADLVTLKSLEGLVEAAPAVRLAEAERVAAESLHQVAVAGASPRLFASGVLGHARDPVRTEQYMVQTLRPDGSVDELTQRLTPAGIGHTRYGALVGVRIPLFGSREVLLRDIDSAKGNVGLQRLKEQLSRMEALKALRYAYVEAWYRRRQGRLANAFLGGEEEAKRTLLLRTSAQVLLEAERKALDGHFFTARHIAAQAAAAGADGLQRVQILAGRALPRDSLAPPAFAVDCVARAALERALDAHPDILFHAAQLEHKRRLLAAAGAGLVEGGISLSHGRAREAGGGAGHNTTVALEISLPLFAADWRRAQRGLASAEVGKAQLMLDTRRQEYLASLGRLFGDLDARGQHLRLAQQRLDAAKEAYRVAALRSDRLDPDPVAALLQAKFSLYAAANDQLEAALALARAKIDVLGYGVGCNPPAAAETGDDAHRAADALAQVYPLLAPGLPAKAAPGAAAWYAWKAFQRFAAAPAAFWPDLPAASRILLSLDGAEIQAVLQDERQGALLRAFLHGAAGRGASVELLLADPEWALPDRGDSLVSLVVALARFPFAGVHLDLERMQLAELQRGAWPDGLVATVAKLKAVSALPLAVSLHPRDAEVEGLLQRLQDAGLAEVTFMAYLTDPARVATMLAPVLRRQPRLRFSVAQSVEPQLPRDQSYAHFPRDQRAAAWSVLAARLGQEPNFAGIVIQSLEDYLDGARHED
jgi:outer membrane protein TolC